MKRLISRALAVCLGTLAWLSSACSSDDSRTLVLVRVDADAEARALATDLRVQIRGYLEAPAVVGADDAAPGTDVTNTDKMYPLASLTGTWPYTFVIAPLNDDARRHYDVTVTLRGSKGDIGVQRVISGFAQGKTLELLLRFEGRCLAMNGPNCKPTETCSQGTCIPAKVAPDKLPELSDQGTAAGSGSAGRGATASGQNASGAGASGAGGGAGDAPGGTAGAGGEPVLVTEKGTVCGDGVVSGDESCDTALASDADGACPSACAAERCTTQALEGSGCQAECVSTPITAVAPDDACCPPGANAASDSDCSASCGNGSVEANETCDPVASCPTSATCKSDDKCVVATLSGDPQQCNAECKMERIVRCRRGDGCCPMGCSRANDFDCPVKCGDGVVDFGAGETCEPNDFLLFPCPNAATCKSSGCMTKTLTGSAAQCNAQCATTMITAVRSGDGCCPPGANASTDSDCNARCGNGAIESGELCDGNCPETAAACNDNNACTTDRVSGADCTRKCDNTPIAASASPDNCCPPGANAATDPDCMGCGNKVVESGELCDGNCPSSPSDCSPPLTDPCEDYEVRGSECRRQCAVKQRAPSRTPDRCCPQGQDFNADADCPGCGDGMQGAGEECDGSPPSGACNDNDDCTTDSASCTGNCRLACSNVPVPDCPAPPQQ